MTNAPETRHRSQGMLLGVFSSLSFFSLFLISHIFENLLYDNLINNRDKWNGQNIREYEISYWFKHSFVIEVPAYNLRFEKLTLGYQVTWEALLLCLACLIGFLIHRYWMEKGWQLLIPSALYVIAPFVVAMWFYPDVFETKLVAILYLGLIYIMRGSMRFNPHLEIRASGPVKTEIISGIMKLYQQYTLISLAVIGLTSTTFLFALESSFRELNKGFEQAQLLPLIEWPNYSAQVYLILAGCAGLFIGVTREFHVKQHEIFRTKFDSEPEISLV